MEEMNTSAEVKGQGKADESTIGDLGADVGNVIRSPGRTLTLDQFGRVSRIIYPDKREFTYTYDEMDNLVEMGDSLMGFTSFNYDILDRLIKTTYPDGATLYCIYDAVGNRVKLTYPDGQVVSYKYNANNWLTEVASAVGATSYYYDRLGRVTRYVLPNGVTTRYSYNSMGKLIKIRITDASENRLFEFSYQYDEYGNYTKIQKSGNATLYSYDSLSRLERVSYHDGSKVEYEYDPDGNRLSTKIESLDNRNSRLIRPLVEPAKKLGFLKNELRYKYSHDGLLMSTGRVKFKYDGNGNLVEKKSGNQATQYKYDSEDKLVRIDYANGSYTEYSYDGLGRRIAERVKKGKNLRYIYDGQNVIQELDDDNRIVVTYVYDLGIDRPISMTRDGEIYYYLYDHLGSVIGLTNSEGDVVAKYEYDPWGNIITETGSIKNHIRFVGRQWNKDSGLYYFRASALTS